MFVNVINLVNIGFNSYFDNYKLFATPYKRKEIIDLGNHLLLLSTNTTLFYILDLIFQCQIESYVNIT